MMPLSRAQVLAEDLVAAMAPYCERIEIAGSIRCAKESVKDIEIIYIPRWKSETVTVGLFGEEKTYDINTLHSWATNDTDLHPHGLQWIKTGTSEIWLWTPKSDGKQWKCYLPVHDIKVDVFLATPQNWGAILMIRTGSAEFNREVMSHARRIGRPCEGGQFTIGGVPCATPEQSNVFEKLNLRYVEPSKRRFAGDVRRL